MTVPIELAAETRPHDERIVRIAAMGDLHCTRTSQGQLEPIFAEAGRAADVLVLCGDLTDYGLPEEARVLVRELATSKIPVLGVLGNHDHESGHAEEVRRILAHAGIRILDGDAVEVRGVGFAGAKGFAGGFGAHTLGPWGEKIIKAFVHETVEEALKLEGALRRLAGSVRIAVMHYSPIRATVEGEAAEILAFLGSSRLEEPLLRHPLTAVLHAHAHYGRPEGRTANDVRVYNVAVPVLKRHFPGRPPFRLLEVDTGGEPAMQPAGR